MSESFDFADVEVFTAGTVGPTGQRVFYLQARTATEVISLRLEKQQVAALAEYLARVLEDLPDLTSLPQVFDTTFVEPIIEHWTAASMGVAYDDRDNRLLVFVEEMLFDTDEESDEDEPATARFKLHTSQVASFVQHARDLVAAGRPPCPYCARPLEADADGWCLCSN